MSLPGCKHLTVFDCFCVGICYRCIHTWRFRDSEVEMWICKSILYNCFTYCTNCLWCACIRSLVLTKSALHRFISGMCKGSISYIFHNPMLNILNIPISGGSGHRWILSLWSTHSHAHCMASSLLFSNYLIQCFDVSVYSLS